MSKTHAILATFAIATAIPAVGYPCRDFRFLNESEGAALVAKAEQKMKAGDYAGVLRAFEDDYWTDMADWRHGNKRMELVAIANIRTGRVQTGLMSLQWLVKKNKNDPYLLTRYAEGLAMTKSGRARALAILERLDQQDLITDAEGYATLASLRTGEGAVQAAARCRAMTEDTSLCPKPSV